MRARYGIKPWINGWVLAVITVLCACSPKGEASAQNDALTVEHSREMPESLELPLPEMPPELTTPHERAAYILEHFWDGLDFCDTLRSHNRKLMELNFVNFISLFPHAAEEALPQPVGQLLERAMTDETAFHLVTNLAETYLSEPDSPMRNEDYYILFLEELLQLPGLPEAERLRPTRQLETAKKNRPGMVATDFAYTTREGIRRTLHTTQGSLLLVIFYDPECGHCNEIIQSLHASALLQRLIEDKVLTVLAVYTEGKEEIWKEKLSVMPQEWTVGIDNSRIVERELYDLPAMPTLYLLDKNKTVLLKDPNQMQLETDLTR